MRLGVYFDGFAATSDMLDSARAAEAAGAASLWFAQHMGYRDAFLSAAAAAGVTSRGRARAYRDQRLSVAAAVGRDVDRPRSIEMSGGRANPDDWRSVTFSISASLASSPSSPMKVMREYVAAMRGLLARRGRAARRRSAPAARRAHGGSRSRRRPSRSWSHRPASIRCGSRARSATASCSRPD